MHNGLKITTKVNSNPFSPKSPITNWISIISKNFYDLLVDTNECFYSMLLTDFINDSWYKHIGTCISRRNVNLIMKQSFLMWSRRWRILIWIFWQLKFRYFLKIQDNLRDTIWFVPGTVHEYAIPRLWNIIFHVETSSFTINHCSSLFYMHVKAWNQSSGESFVE